MVSSWSADWPLTGESVDIEKWRAQQCSLPPGHQGVAVGAAKFASSISPEVRASFLSAESRGFEPRMAFAGIDHHGDSAIGSVLCVGNCVARWTALAHIHSQPQLRPRSLRWDSAVVVSRIAICPPPK